MQGKEVVSLGSDFKHSAWSPSSMRCRLSELREDHQLQGCLVSVVFGPFCGCARPVDEITRVDVYKQMCSDHDAACLSCVHVRVDPIDPTTNERFPCKSARHTTALELPAASRERSGSVISSAGQTPKCRFKAWTKPALTNLSPI